jgi:hypothetical protein
MIRQWVMADDDMVGYPNPEDVSDLPKSFGYLDILVAGSKVPAWMVVHQDDGRCVAQNGLRKNFAWMDKRRVQSA